MKKIYLVLKKVEDKIGSIAERNYFFTHEVRYRNTLLLIEKISDGKKLRILDIGCFPYHVGKALELLGHDVYGIASAHEKIKNKKIVCMNIEKDLFPFDDDFFDLTLFNEVIEHLPQSPVIPLLEILRITKKSGKLMITTPNIARLFNRIKMMIGKSPNFPIEVYFEENGKGNNIYHRHNREYTLSELINVIEKCGWKITKKSYWISYTPFRRRVIPDPLWLKSIKILNYFLIFLFPSFQDTLLVLGEK